MDCIVKRDSLGKLTRSKKEKQEPLVVRSQSVLQPTSSSCTETQIRKRQIPPFHKCPMERTTWIPFQSLLRKRDEGRTAHHRGHTAFVKLLLLLTTESPVVYSACACVCVYTRMQSCLHACMWKLFPYARLDWINCIWKNNINFGKAWLRSSRLTDKASKP